MDIFNREKVWQLEEEIALLKDLVAKETKRAEYAENKLEQLSHIVDNRPSDCVMGKYCEGCAFVKTFHYTIGAHRDYTWGYYCGKGESCKNFVQKEGKE